MYMDIIKQIFKLRKVPMLILAALFVIAVILQAYILVYQQPKINETRVQWLKEREAEAGRGYHPGRESGYKTALADLQKFRERIYQKSDFAKFVSELYTISSKNSLIIDSITYVPTFDKESNLLQYVLTLSVSGNYLQLKRFVYDVSRSTNPLFVTSVSLVNQKTTEAAVQLKVQICTYFRMEAQ